MLAFILGKWIPIQKVLFCMYVSKITAYGFF